MGHTLRKWIPAVLLSALCAGALSAQSAIASADSPEQVAALALVTLPDLIAADRVSAEFVPRVAAPDAVALNPSDDFAAYLHTARRPLAGAYSYSGPPAPMASAQTSPAGGPRRAQRPKANASVQLLTAQNLFRPQNITPCQNCGMKQRIVTGLLATPPRMRPIAPAGAVPDAGKHSTGGMRVNFVW